MSPRITLIHSALAVGLALAAAPALAADQPATDADGRVFGDAAYDPRPEWKPAASSIPSAAAQRAALPAMPAAAPAAQPGYDRAAWDDAKADWLSECRRRYGGRGGTTGAVVGGLLGGVAGSAIAGRGNRTIGAIAGGTIGAVAGSAVGRSADRRKARDYCESYLEDYLARQQAPGYAGYGYGQPGYSYGYAMQPVMMMVPVAMTTMAAPPVAAAPQGDCKETTVIEEWVPVATPRKRYIAPRRSYVPDKRVRIVPDKRVRTN